MLINSFTLIKQFDMASTAHKTEEAKKQFFDPEDVLEKKVKKLAYLIFDSKHFIAFTGAGISTACGIPDYRSGINTVLKTGPGAWEKRAQNVQNKPNNNIVDMAKAIPSFTHMTLIALQEAGYLKFLVSQNTDGLHMRSGFDVQKLAELHGNRCLEKCRNCGCKFLRDFRTRQATMAKSHETSRKCQKCNETLYDSIINFGESLPKYQLEKSFEEAGKADLCLAMGSSLTVTPASMIPETVSNKGKLVIINLQATPLDKHAFLRINAKCEDVMVLLAKRMELKVKDFILNRMINFRINEKNDFQFRGIDKRGIPFSFFHKVFAGFDGEKESIREELKGQPYILSKEFKKGYLEMEFFRYYGQPELTLNIKNLREGNLMLEYSPKVGEWIKKQWVQSIEKEKEEPIQVSKLEEAD